MSAESGGVSGRDRSAEYGKSGHDRDARTLEERDDVRLRWALAARAASRQMLDLRDSGGSERELLAAVSADSETVRVRLPEDADERFRAVVTASEAILEVATEPKDEP